MSLIRPLRIGAFTAPNNLLLAPMAGITDGPFRILCLRGGAGIVCAEMVSAHALHYGNPKSDRMLTVSPKEHPVSMQIFGSDEQTIQEAARQAQARGRAAQRLLVQNHHRTRPRETGRPPPLPPGGPAPRLAIADWL